MALRMQELPGVGARKHNLPLARPSCGGAAQPVKWQEFNRLEWFQ
jgi:hypothetical protein